MCRLPQRRRGHGRRSDGGMVTAEVALALPALVIVVAALLSVIAAVAGQLRCVAAAREGARAAARGESAEVVQQLTIRAAPEGAQVDVSSAADTVTVVVTASVHPLGVSVAEIQVSGQATALREPEPATPGASMATLGPWLPVLAWRLRMRDGPRRARSEASSRRRQRRSGAGDRGSGTVYAVALLAVLGVVAGGVAFVAKAYVAQQRAAAAADLGALAGARALVDGVSDPCAAADQIVQRNGADLADCVIEGQTVLITSSVAVDLGGFGVREATARARAGPVGVGRGG